MAWLQDSLQITSKPGGHAFCKLIIHEKDLAYGEIRTTVWRDKTLQSKRSSTELTGPGSTISLFTSETFEVKHLKEQYQNWTFVPKVLFVFPGKQQQEFELVFPVSVNRVLWKKNSFMFLLSRHNVGMSVSNEPTPFIKATIEELSNIATVLILFSD